MSDIRNKLNEFSETENVRTSMVQIVLVLSLSSIVLVFKNSIIGGIPFIWADCLNMSVSVFTILFMTFFREKDIFEAWKERFLEKKTRILFIYYSFLGIIIIVVFNFAMRYMYDGNWIFNHTTYDFGFVVFSSAIFQAPFIWLADFISYFLFTLFLIFMYIPVVLFFFDKIKQKIE